MSDEKSKAVLEEKYSKHLGVKYVSIENNFLTETGVLFSHGEVKGATIEAKKEAYLKRLEEPLYDYAYALNAGYLRKHKDPDGLRSSAYAKLKAMTPEVLRSAKSFFSLLRVDPISVLILALVAVGCGTSLMSGLYTQEFLTPYHGSFKAAILSWSIIIFSVSSFDLIVVFWSLHGEKRSNGRQRRYHWLSAMFAVLWVITVAFSMISTASVNYDGFQRMAKESSSENADTNSSRLILSSLAEKKDVAKREWENSIEAAEEYASREEYSVWRLGEMQKETSKLSDAYKAILSQEEAIFKDNPDAAISTETRVQTLYDSIENMMGIPAEKVHFAVHTLPALFIDIMAPFSIAAALFLGGIKNGKRKEEDGSELD